LSLAKKYKRKLSNKSLTKKDKRKYSKKSLNKKDGRKYSKKSLNKKPKSIKKSKSTKKPKSTKKTINKKKLLGNGMNNISCYLSKLHYNIREFFNNKGDYKRMKEVDEKFPKFDQEQLLYCENLSNKEIEEISKLNIKAILNDLDEQYNRNEIVDWIELQNKYLNIIKPLLDRKLPNSELHPLDVKTMLSTRDYPVGSTLKSPPPTTIGSRRIELSRRPITHKEKEQEAKDQEIKKQGKISQLNLEYQGTNLPGIQKLK
jgi:hypothetical protein